MAKHAGCFICGSVDDETLRSIPDMRVMSSVAICSKCYALPDDDLRRKLDAIRAAMEKARRAAANG